MLHGLSLYTYWYNDILFISFLQQSFSIFLSPSLLPLHFSLSSQACTMFCNNHVIYQYCLYFLSCLITNRICNNLWYWLHTSLNETDNHGASIHEMHNMKREVDASKSLQFVNLWQYSFEARKRTWPCQSSSSNYIKIDLWSSQGITLEQHTFKILKKASHRLFCFQRSENSP